MYIRYICIYCIVILYINELYMHKCKINRFPKKSIIERLGIMGTGVTTNFQPPGSSHYIHVYIYIYIHMKNKEISSHMLHIHAYLGEFLAKVPATKDLLLPPECCRKETPSFKM